MVTFPFTVDDLARTRFAISPLWELITSLQMLQDAGRAAAHIAWVREAMPVARKLDLAVALRLTPTQGYMPYFLTPPPTTPVATFEDELETLCATPAATVRGDVGRLFGAGRPPALLDPLLAHPRRELKRMAAVLAEFWELTLEPHWPRIRALLEADLAYRARCLTERGAAGLFTDLHGSVVWENDVLELRDSACEGPHSLGGKGLLLVPSAFQWQRPATIVDPPWQPTLLYPARGVGLLWEQPDQLDADTQLAGVLGATRAHLLTALDAPRSTTALAAQIDLSAGGVSQHLSALKDAGLVSGTRHGRSVLYVRTPLAEQMVGTSGGPTPPRPPRAR